MHKWMEGFVVVVVWVFVCLFDLCVCVGGSVTVLRLCFSFLCFVSIFRSNKQATYVINVHIVLF